MIMDTDMVESRLQFINHRHMDMDTGLIIHKLVFLGTRAIGEVAVERVQVQTSACAPEPSPPWRPVRAGACRRYNIVHLQMVMYIIYITDIYLKYSMGIRHCHWPIRVSDSLRVNLSHWPSGHWCAHDTS